MSALSVVLYIASNGSANFDNEDVETNENINGQQNITVADSKYKNNKKSIEVDAESHKIMNLSGKKQRSMIEIEFLNLTFSN